MKKPFETAPKDGRHILGWWRRSKDDAARGYSQIYWCKRYNKWSFANSASFLSTPPDKWDRIK